MQCVEADFEWTVEPDIPSLNGREKANLHVPPSYLFPGSQYKFSVNVSLNGTTQREFVVVDVMPLKPTGFIGGGSRQVPYDRKLDVTFIKTFDEHLLVSIRLSNAFQLMLLLLLFSRNCLGLILFSIPLFSQVMQTSPTSGHAVGKTSCLPLAGRHAM